MPHILVTAQYCILNDTETTDAVTMKIANAGHPRPILFRGLLYKETGLNLSRGDIVILYTDGLPETINAKQQIYGYDRMPGLVKDACIENSGDPLEYMFGKLDKFRGNAEVEDDRVAICIKIK